MLRGNSPAKIDDRGRLKIPNGFRAFIEDEHGRDLFVTSLHGDSVRIYPMPIWVDVEKKLAQMPSSHPSRLKFLDRVNFYGQVTEFDVQSFIMGAFERNGLFADHEPIVGVNANASDPHYCTGQSVSE